jgi:Tol biopolymer transport system component
MRRLALVSLAACRIGFDPLGEASDGPMAGDDAAVSDAPGSGADLGAWPMAVPVPNASTANEEQDVTASSDKTEIYFSFGSTNDLYVITRPTIAGPFGARQPLSINTGSVEGYPRLSPDDLTLYFASNRTGSQGGTDIWSTTRTAVGQSWSAPVLVPGVSSNGNDRWLSTCAGGRYVVTHDQQDLMEGVLGSGAPTRIAELDTSGTNTAGHLSPDCLTLYFSSDRSGNQFDLYATTRAAVGNPWQTPVPLSDFNASGDEDDPWMSPDQRLFVFTSDRSGNHDLYMSTR